jgi:hypothetical protein
MASLIPGFNYDVFISYRQKDNKNNGWVSEFVDNLRRELETTIKEEISVYFDINQFDGLLETHDVKASIEEKLKSLVFIPILSRIYCDPRSYAWEHEFKAFIEQASQDQFGLKILLINGNVASRVLPVRIYDLCSDDIKIVERKLGVIRSIDFIYHSKGVNRPLREWDDDVIKATNQLFYRDQINKVANAIDEIISSMKRIHVGTVMESTLLNGQSVQGKLYEKGTFLDYKGPVDVRVMDLLLNQLKTAHEFMVLDKTTGKKVYSILAECLDNISKYSGRKSTGNDIIHASVSVRKHLDKIIVKAENPIANDKINALVKKLKHINAVDEDTLKKIYDERITSELRLGENREGLGFVLMILKSGNSIEYKITRSNGNYSLFEIQVSINKFIGKKLIIEPTSNSPKVFFDPGNNTFEISGESRPTDVAGFYKLILNWLDSFAKDLIQSEEMKEQVEFNLNFEYFNSSSSKYILDFCRQIASIRSKRKDVTIKWHYDEDDADIIESGKEMSRIAGFPFEFVKKSTKYGYPE